MKQHLSARKHLLLSDDDTDINHYNKKVYRCKECAKIYTDKSNFNRHIKVTHAKKQQAEVDVMCDNSGGIYNDSTFEMIQHINKIEDIDTRTKMLDTMKMIWNDKNKMAVLEKENIVKNKELEFTAKMKDIYENENEYHKNVANNAGQIVNKTMNMLTYAMQNLKKTPELELLDSKTARNLLKYDAKGEKNSYQIAEYIAKISEAKILPKHLGNTLVFHYKKDDPQRQSLWTTDVSRMKFITKTNNGWMKDSNGDIINKNMINPLLKEVVGVMDEYCKERSSNIDKMSALEESRYVEVVTQVLNIKSDVKSEKINKAIIKHITPYFLMHKQLCR
jgi:hypothetical protein